MKSRFTEIIFDLDGTLADSQEGIINSILYALRKMNLAEPEREELKSFIGPPLIDSVEKKFGLNSEQADEAVKYYREYFSLKGIFENHLYEGVHDMLKILNKSGKNIYLATSKPDVYVDVILPYFKIDQYFHGISAANIEQELLHKKDILNVLFKKYPEINKTSSVIIGDRIYDIFGANENGIRAIGVTWGYGDQEELQVEKPYAIVNSIDELITILI